MIWFELKTQIKKGGIFNTIFKVFFPPGPETVQVVVKWDFGVGFPKTVESWLK